MAIYRMKTTTSQVLKLGQILVNLLRYLLLGTSPFQKLKIRPQSKQSKLLNALFLILQLAGSKYVHGAHSNIINRALVVRHFLPFAFPFAFMSQRSRSRSRSSQKNAVPVRVHKKVNAFANAVHLNAVHERKLI